MTFTLFFFLVLIWLSSRLGILKIASFSPQAEEWEKRFNPQRLLPEGKRSDGDDDATEEIEGAEEKVITVGTRNRPKREE
jgi:biopolymer transport protein ExbB/TolQ